MLPSVYDRSLNKRTSPTQRSYEANRSQGIITTPSTSHQNMRFRCCDVLDRGLCLIALSQKSDQHNTLSDSPRLSALPCAPRLTRPLPLVPPSLPSPALTPSFSSPFPPAHRLAHNKVSPQL